jgi:hypothetical protein
MIKWFGFYSSYNTWETAECLNEAALNSYKADTTCSLACKSFQQVSLRKERKRREGKRKDNKDKKSSKRDKASQMVAEGSVFKISE